MLSQSQKQSRGRASQGDLLCSIGVSASPRLSQRQQRGPVQQRCSGTAKSTHPSLTSANLCAESPAALAVPTDPRPARPPELWRCWGDSSPWFYSISASVIEALPPRIRRHEFSLTKLGKKLLAVINGKLSWASDFQMEIMLFWGHFHCERWFKGTRGKGRVSSKLPSKRVQFF